MDVIDRFLKYVSYHTTSDEQSDTVPSSSRQLKLAEDLRDELIGLGLKDARVDPFGRVAAHLPGSAGMESTPALGLIAHMDTSPDASGENVSPQIIRYEGGDITLKNGLVIDPEHYRFLQNMKGQELIVTDGNTLLGADDKAGIAEIVTLCQRLAEDPSLPHRPLSICFTPDEEIGCGADHFDHTFFHAPVAYTVDGGELGEIEYENFNAASAKVTVHGVVCHPGSAKGVMKNAVLMANEFISLLPAKEIPAETEGYEGFYHVTDLNGCESEAAIHMIIRDHDRDLFEHRKKTVEEICDKLNSKYGSGAFVAEIRDSYYNMKEKILPHMELIENAKEAMASVGVEPRIMAIRGGTDGARLSYEGLPCPNLSTGGVNFHSVRELIPVDSLRKMVDVLQYLSAKI